MRVLNCIGRTCLLVVICSFYLLGIPAYTTWSRLERVGRLEVLRNYDESVDLVSGKILSPARTAKALVGLQALDISRYSMELYIRASVDENYHVTDLSVWESVPPPTALRVSNVSEIQAPIWLDATIAVEPVSVLYLVCNSKSFKRLFTIFIGENYVR